MLSRWMDDGSCSDCCTYVEEKASRFFLQAGARWNTRKGKEHIIRSTLKKTELGKEWLEMLSKLCLLSVGGDGSLEESVDLFPGKIIATLTASCTMEKDDFV
ncbi:hypothetical protein OPV22_004438 [Ensete ventricosum]|uniref:Uncharacterized protein n=1 Tax=Ensete ventricosum TaxID=4639 RepID=A0AAV8S3U3_ENSVE|nr:hypothetical protein OPV22_004438 [Ensete ventricosum]